MRFGKKGKLAPKYFGPFKIRSRVSEVAYMLVFPPELLRIHPVFHMSMLRKYISDPSHVFQRQAVELSEDLTYDEFPVEVVDRQIRQLRTKDTTTVEVLWSKHTTKDCTWVAYPYLIHF